MLNLLSLYQAEHHPLSHQKNALEERQDAIRQLEDGASTIRVFQPVLIPGLLQTRKYISAVFSRYADGPGDLVLSVKKRMERQSIIEDEQRSFRLLFSENSLLTNICSHAVMLDQIRAIKRFARRSNVTIGYLPGGIEMPAGMRIPMSGFEALDDALIIVDTLVGFMSFRHPDEVAQYLNVFDQLDNISLRDEAMFQEIEKCLRRR